MPMPPSPLDHPHFIFGVSFAFFLVEALIFLCLFLVVDSIWALLGLPVVHLAGMIYTWRRIKKLSQADEAQSPEDKSK